MEANVLTVSGKPHFRLRVEWSTRRVTRSGNRYRGRRRSRTRRYRCRSRTARATNVALLDIEMPGGGWLVAAYALQRALPSCRIVILTTFGRSGYLRRAMESGAVGFLLKDAPATELACALRRVMHGERVVDPELASLALSEGNNPLTNREREVLAAALPGSSHAEIASCLSLSEGTVRNHLSAAMQKLGTHNRMEAAHLADQKGWLLSRMEVDPRCQWGSMVQIERSTKKQERVNANDPSSTLSFSTSRPCT